MDCIKNKARINCILFSKTKAVCLKEIYVLNFIISKQIMNMQFITYRWDLVKAN